jgi:hypothetical protein
LKEGLSTWFEEGHYTKSFEPERHLICPRCGEAMRIVAFIQDPPVIERILHHIAEPTEAPQVLPARAPPPHALEFDQSAEDDEWPNEEQTAGDTDDFVQ